MRGRWFVLGSNPGRSLVQKLNVGALVSLDGVKQPPGGHSQQRTVTGHDQERNLPLV